VNKQHLGQKHDIHIPWSAISVLISA